ncbi:MAG: hypothetical protein E7J49_07145 [Finegoldia magna]|uniref:hypothetical protein n=1 Tax=Finegoldia magna TaxID=1260 RepID=UPI00290FF38F|nr:hypothetical protein [Finegoldia magna]MDU7890977.1 hypothetical protein [Finegoldia magna]
MGYDGKIKNGLILKKSEEGLFEKIIKKLNWNSEECLFQRIIKKQNCNNEAWYKLSYDEQGHKYFDKEFLLKYLNENYLNDKIKKIDEKNLINDLITFKTYSDDVDINIRNESDIGQIFSIGIAIIALLTNIVDHAQINRELILALEILAIVIFLIYRSITGSKSESYKLKVINNVIYTLETIKEDMYRNGNWGTKSYEKYEGLELTEVKEIRTYTYKARKNKYSPRAMHEKKRR